MAGKGRNSGIHMLEDFVTEAIHNPSVRLATPKKQGQSGGITMLEEVVCDFGKPPHRDDQTNLPTQEGNPQSNSEKDQNTDEPSTGTDTPNA